MEMRNVLSDQKTGKGFSGDTISFVRINGSDELDPFGTCRVEDGTTANALDGNTVNEVGFSEVLPCTNNARKEAQGIRLNSREAEPTDFKADTKGTTNWEKWYKILWQWKLAFIKKNYG